MSRIKTETDLIVIPQFHLGISMQLNFSGMQTINIEQKPTDFRETERSINSLKVELNNCKKKLEDKEAEVKKLITQVAQSSVMAGKVVSSKNKVENLMKYLESFISSGSPTQLEELKTVCKTFLEELS